MSDPLGLTGKTAIVTGAAGGIGREVARGFASVGVRVALVDVDVDACRAVAEETPGGDHPPIGCDLRDVSSFAELVGSIRESFGRIDILACLAAVLRRRATIDDVTLEDWDIQLDVNLKSVFFLNREVATVFREQGVGGRIINFSSQGWWTGGFGGSVVYAASKGGVVSMTRGLARTLAPDGITVNAVAPGAADTSMMRSGMSDVDLAEFVKMIPLGRMAEPSEVAGAVVFLASDLARYITGATINVSGGQLMY